MWKWSDFGLIPVRLRSGSSPGEDSGDHSLMASRNYSAVKSRNKEEYTENLVRNFFFVSLRIKTITAFRALISKSNALPLDRSHELKIGSK